MEYDVVEEPTTDDLVKEVKIWINTGWKPQGGIAVTPHSDSPSGLLFFQAMVRDQDAILPAD